MHRLVASAVLIAVLAAAAADAAVTFGLNPFGSLTGTVTGNGSPANLSNRDIYSSSFVGPSPAGPLYYEMRWNTPTGPMDVGAILLDTIHRDLGGTILGATTSGGAFSTPLGSFSMGIGRTLLLPNTGPGSLYGVRIEGSTSTSSPLYYQLGEVELLGVNPGPNLALGAATINSPGSAYGSGSITDQDIYSAWRSGTTADENWVGFDFGAGVTRSIGALRVASANWHGATYTWRDFDLQISTDGVNWTTLGRASTPGSEMVYWIDLGGAYEIQALRLYGSTAGGNNPTGSGGKIVEETMAFAPIPEPAGLGLFLAAAGWLAARRRRD